MEQVAQTFEVNRGRPEARAVETFAVTAETICFPHAEQAAQLWRAVDYPKKNKTSFEKVFLLTSHNPEHYDCEDILRDKRAYWGIENGLHQRLDCSAMEDKSRVRTFNSAWNLGMFRRVAVSFAVQWIQRQPDPRQATLPGFFDAMSENKARKAFALVTATKASWLP